MEKHQFFGRRGEKGVRVERPHKSHRRVAWLPKVGAIFPDFTAPTTQGLLSLHDWADGCWVYFFSHPAAFTPICTTELASLAQNAAAFEQRKVKLLTLSADDTLAQKRWIAQIEAAFGTMIDYPFISDEDLLIAHHSGMIHPDDGGDLPIRRSFFLDPQMRICMIHDYPSSVGRNTDEVLRAFDALQAADRYKLGTPAEWRRGQEFVVLPDESSASVQERLQAQPRDVLPFLRMISIEPRVTAKRST